MRERERVRDERESNFTKENTSKIIIKTKNDEREREKERETAE
jgi:hypothetical protein